MTIKTIDAKTLKTWLANDEAVLIDVREPEEYKQQNIKEATLIPLSNVCTKLLPNRAGKKLVIHCRSGKRSMIACEKLCAENPQLEVYNLKGGILAW